MATKNKEIRTCGTVEIREAPAGAASPGTIFGYAARWNSDSEDLGGFRESIAQGAFTRSLKDNPDVRMLLGHDPNLVLGRTVSKTLAVREDGTGLLIECVLPDASYARDLAAVMKRGDVTGQSFGFIPQKDAWAVVGNQVKRTLMDVDLLECSIATFPAYPETSAAVRSMAEELRAARKTDVNGAGLEAAKAALAEGRVDQDSAWDFSAEDGDALLAPGEDWTRYASAFLGVDPEMDEKTKGRYAFPWGKMKDGKLLLFRKAVAAARQRASQHGHEAIFAAAGELMAALEKDSGRAWEMENLEMRQRLAEVG